MFEVEINNIIRVLHYLAYKGIFQTFLSVRELAIIEEALKHMRDKL